MRTHPISWFSAGLLALLAVSPLVASEAPEPRAEAAMDALAQTLREALQARLQNEGVVAAIDFCQQQAPLLTAAVAERHQLRLGRSALRVRNPDNAPNAWLQVVLADFAAQAAAGADPATLRYRSAAGGAEQRFARGLATETPCLLCYGPALAAPVAAAIRQHYPQDAATGFEAGSLRGLIWVEIDQVPPANSAD